MVTPCFFSVADVDLDFLAMVRCEGNLVVVLCRLLKCRPLEDNREYDLNT